MENYMQIHHTDTDITITETEYIFHTKRPQGFTFEKADQDYYLVAMILDGRAQYKMNQKTFTVQKGDVLFFRKGAHYTAKVISKEQWEHIAVAFRIAGDIGDFPTEGATRVSHGNRLAELFRQVYSVWSGCGFGYKLQTKALLHQILFSLMQENVSHMVDCDTALQALKAATDYMEQNYRDKITVEELAVRSGYSASHFARIFTKVYNTSPIQYLNQIRILHAKNLLRTGQYTMGQIAQECGFSNVYYFSRCFKQITGTTPGKW